MTFRPLISAGLLAAVALGTAQPASALTFKVTHGQNVAVVSSTGGEVTLCDGEDDHNAVQVQYVRASGNGGAFWEKRGPGACSTSGSGTTIVRMRLCEQVWGGGNNCTGWKTNPNRAGSHVGSPTSGRDSGGEALPPSRVPSRPDDIGPARPVPRTGR
ncbi:hypothetical protein GCM10017673_39410 [Streptosporangium violaceochromogenes]|nr:hypothetical protein GCM10017673_39410 [Streptosporangium violaceochromogenes]